MKTLHRFAVVGLPVALAIGGMFLLVSCPSRDETSQPAAGGPPDAVARLGDSFVTRAELEERLVREIRPRDEDSYQAPREPVTPESVLREILAEKAMSLEGRRLGYLQDEQLASSIQQSEHQRLAQMVAENCLRERMGTDESKVEELRKTDPTLTLDQARVVVRRQILEQLRGELTEKFQLKKLSDNFMEAALIHQRLLHQPAQPRSESWILNRQVRNELSEKEKSLPLATYQGGQFTLKEWFQAVCNIVPPRRPSDLNTPAGVGRLLENALWVPLLVAEAKARGYDQDEKLRRDIRQMEDQRLLYKVIEEKTKGLAEPTAEQTKAYFEKNAERFAQPATLKLSQIWCADLEKARQAKAELDGGADFETVRKDHSLQKEETPYPVSAGGEGLFWAELWQGEPNQVLGPVRGFYGSGVKWRLVKILEKTPAKAQEYSEQTANNAKWAWMDEQRQRLLADYRKELLAKCAPEIFHDRIKDIDPLEIAMTKGDN